MKPRRLGLLRINSLYIESLLDVDDRYLFWSLSLCSVPDNDLGKGEGSIFSLFRVELSSVES